MGVETALMIAAISMAAGTTATISANNTAAKTANSAKLDAERKATAAAAEAAALPQKQAEAAAQAAQDTLKRKALRTKTLLTSSMGVLSEAQTDKKTLLGS